MDISIELWMNIGLAIVLILIVLYLVIREKEYANKLSRYEQALDNLTHNIHTLKKNQDLFQATPEINTKEVEAIISQMVDSEFKKSLEQIANHLDKSKDRFEEYQKEMEDRLDFLDEKIHLIRSN